MCTGPSTNPSRLFIVKGLREALGMVVDPLVERTFGGPFGKRRRGSWIRVERTQTARGLMI